MENNATNRRKGGYHASLMGRDDVQTWLNSLSPEMRAVAEKDVKAHARDWDSRQTVQVSTSTQASVVDTVYRPERHRINGRKVDVLSVEALNEEFHQGSNEGESDLSVLDFQANTGADGFELFRQAVCLEGDDELSPSIRLVLEYNLPDEIKLITERYKEGKTYEDLAKRYGVNETTIRQRVSRAVKAIRTLVMREVRDGL